ncbi:MAG: hypothetical protein ACMUHY_07430 [Thermoplasmatota archaeon]
MSLFGKKEIEYRDQRILELEEENGRLRERIESLERRVEELIANLSLKDPELGQVEKKRTLLLRDMTEFDAYRRNHEKKWDEFQERYLKFREEFREFEEWKKQKQ